MSYLVVQSNQIGMKMLQLNFFEFFNRVLKVTFEIDLIIHLIMNRIWIELVVFDFLSDVIWKKYILNLIC